MRFFITVFLCYCCSAGLYAQNPSYKKLGEKIAIEAASMNAATLLQQLQQQTGFTFIYDNSSLQQLNIRPAYFNGTLGSTLEMLQNRYGLQFNLSGKNISVQKGTKSATVKTTSLATLNGNIIDEENGEPIPGVTVSVADKKILSGVDGSFSFKMPPGEYIALATAVGYGAKRVTDILVSDDQITTITITLRREKGQLAGVTVSTSAHKESVAALYQLQKNRAFISDGISAEQIARTPDKNVAEIIKRISGLSTVDNKYVVARGLSERYNGAMLNGQLMPSTELNRKQFSFDIIPAALVENIVIYKTVTPDLSAEFGGGLLAVTTKSFPAQNFVSVAAGGSYNDQTTGKSFRSLQLDHRAYLALTPSSRFLLGQHNWDNPGAGIDNFNNNNKPATAFTNNWALYRMKAPVSRNLEVSMGKIIRLPNEGRIGITAAAVYRNTFLTQKVLMARDGFDGTNEGIDPNGAVAAFNGDRYGFTTNLSALAGAGYQKGSFKISAQSIYLRNYDQQLLLGAGYHSDPSGYLAGYYDLTQQASMLQNQLKGELAIGQKGAVFNWMGSYILMTKERPDNHQFYAAVQQKTDVRNSDELNIQSPASNGISEGALRWWTRAKEKNTGWDVNLALPFTMGSATKLLKTTWKNGYSGWYKNRLFYVVNTGSKPQTEYYPPLASAFDPARGNTIYFNRFGDDFRRTAALHAVYTMLDHKIGKWRLVWGLRAEYYNLNGANANLDSLVKDLNRGRGGNTLYDFSDLYNKEPDWNLFPSANLTYGLNASMNLRLAYAKSIVRPDLRELSFFREYDFEQGGAYEAGFIRSTKIHNYDFRYEWYPGAGEVFSLSFFYKKLEYPMEIYKQSTIRGSILQNNKEAVNKGIEIDMRKSLRFTHVPIVQQLTLYGNFTRLFSEVTPMDLQYVDKEGNKVIAIENLREKEKRPQVGASNYLANGGIYFDSRRLKLNLSYNYISNRAYRISTVHAESLFERPLKALDAQVAVPVLQQKGEIRFNIANLLKSYSVVYENRYNEATQTAIQQGAQPSTKDLLYQHGTDNVEYMTNPGRTYSLIFSYRF